MKKSHLKLFIRDGVRRNRFVLMISTGLPQKAVEPKSRNCNLYTDTRLEWIIPKEWAALSAVLYLLTKIKFLYNYGRTFIKYLE